MDADTVKTDRSLAVIMPCFNTRPDYLHSAVNSVVAEKTLIEKQGFDVCLVIVDDASTAKGTLIALEQIEQQIDWVQVIRLPINLGSAASRNRGVVDCGAHWIAFLDSDDYWLQGGISALCTVIDTDPTTTWISGDFYMQFGDRPRENSTFYPSHPERYRHLRIAYERGEPIRLRRPVAEFLDGSLCSMGSCIISAGLLKSVGSFNPMQRKGVDTELYWRLSRESDMVFVPIPTFVYRRHSSSLSADGSRISDWEPLVLKTMLRDLRWRPHGPDLRRRLLRTLMNLSRASWLSGDRSSAMKLALQAVALKPYGRGPWRSIVQSLMRPKTRAR